MYTTVDCIMSFVCAVFRGRGRYIDEDFDLDLTYITERIIGKCGVCSGNIIKVYTSTQL